MGINAIRDAARRKQTEDAETDEGALDRAHRDETRLQTKVEVAEAEDGADGEADERGAKGQLWLLRERRSRARAAGAAEAAEAADADADAADADVDAAGDAAAAAAPAGGRAHESVG